MRHDGRSRSICAVEDTLVAWCTCRACRCRVKGVGPLLIFEPVASAWDTTHARLAVFGVDQAGWNEARKWWGVGELRTVLCRSLENDANRAVTPNRRLVRANPAPIQRSGITRRASEKSNRSSSAAQCSRGRIDMDTVSKCACLF